MIEWCTKHGCRSVSYFYMITMEYYEIKKKKKEWECQKYFDIEGKKKEKVLQHHNAKKKKKLKSKSGNVI